jgi:hypothetical protein
LLAPTLVNEAEYQDAGTGDQQSHATPDVELPEEVAVDDDNESGKALVIW